MKTTSACRVWGHLERAKKWATELKAERDDDELSHRLQRLIEQALKTVEEIHYIDSGEVFF